MNENALEKERPKIVREVKQKGAAEAIRQRLSTDSYTGGISQKGLHREDFTVGITQWGLGSLSNKYWVIQKKLFT